MRRLLLLIVVLQGVLAAGPVLAQPVAPAPPVAAAPAPSQEELRALAALLRDPAIQAWLQAQAEGGPAAATPATPA